MMVNVYASCERVARRRLWEDLKLWKENSEIKEWCVLGDYNCVRRASERQGVHSRDNKGGEMREFLILFMKWSWKRYRVRGKALHGIDQMVKQGIDLIEFWS